MPGLIARFQIRHLYVVLPLAFYAIAVTSGPMGDNSFLWHVRAGTVQMDAGRVLATDPFSYTAAGESWRTQSWLAELLYARLELLLGGVAWAPALVAIVGIGALALLGLAVYSASRSVLATSAGVLLAAWLLAPFGQPRPVIFSYLLLVMLVVTLDEGEKAQWAAIPIVWLWAGLHGTWIIGIGLIVLVAVRRRSARLGLVAAVAVLMSALTAHGLAAWSVLVSFAGSAGALDYLKEWMPPDFGGFVQMPYLLIVAGVVVAATKGKMDPAELWVVLPFLAFGLTSRRAVPVAALVLIPVAARAVSVRLPVAAARWTPVPIAVLVTATAFVGGMYARSSFELDPERFPSVGAIEAVGDGRFFHDLGVGGYLIYRSGPGRLVYIDDRAELYGEARFAEFAAATQGDYEDLFARLDLTSAMVKREWPLHEMLLKDGWMVGHQDESFVVLLLDASPSQP